MPVRRGGCAMFLLAAACAGEREAEWAGTIDTLPGGVVQVTNPATGAWGDATRWQVVEELRIGAEEGEGPEVFGRIGLLAEDAGGRIWAFETTEQQFKVFDASGRFIRTVGRRGGGPGEMQQANGVVVRPDGHLLVVDMQGGRISLFDTAGTYLNGYSISGGFSTTPWPGRVDRNGRLYNPVPIPAADDFRFVLVRHDSAMTPLDTLTPPRGGADHFFEHRREGGSSWAAVPYAPRFTWRLSPEGDFWGLTGDYRLLRITGAGDTVRVVTKPHLPVPVSAAEKDSAVARLKWFTDQGGKVDRGRIPDTKPVAQGFQVADDGYLWVNATRADTSETNRVFEVFDPEGRYLGEVRLPFAMLPYPVPLLRGDRIIAATQDSLGVPYVVRARIVRPAASP